MVVLPFRKFNLKEHAGYKNPGQRRRPGAAAVEMAILAPFLGMLIVGMFELSRGMMARESLCNSARKGCRTGILKQYSNTDIYNDSVNVMRDNGYDISKFNPPPPSGPVPGQTYIGSVTITVTDPNNVTLSDALDAPPGSTVTVQISIPVSSVMWATSNFLQASTIESDVMVMMKQ
jgi:Flp pilus assembly protein TadG